MRYAIISDIHSNMEALTAVSKKIRVLEIDKIYCLGDIVGYNADPQFCIKWVQKKTADVIRGNHDKAVGNVILERRFNTYARYAIQWTRKSLENGEKKYILRLREGPVETDEGIVLCHGTPFDEDAYMSSPQVADASFKFLEEELPSAHVCFFGHTHIPVLFDEDGESDLSEKLVTIEPYKRYLINPGSVGQPRDHDIRASFGVYDTDAKTFELVRVQYSIPEAQRKILMIGLPEVLASRLSAGR